MGVGQSEVAVNGMTDVFLLLLLAGAGDELQGIKRGIMEMADVIAVNKADGDNLGPARTTQQDFRRALHLFAATSDGWKPPVLTCSGLHGDGLDELWSSLLACHGTRTESGALTERRHAQRLAWFEESLLEEWRHHAEEDAGLRDTLSVARSEVDADRLVPSVAAARLFRKS